MKVHELFGNLFDDTAILSKDELPNALRLHDWMAEFCDDDFRINRAQRKLARLEESVYQLWKYEPEEALAMWKKYTPYGQYMEEGVVPGFIARHSAA